MKKYSANQLVYRILSPHDFQRLVASRLLDDGVMGEMKICFAYLRRDGEEINKFTVESAFKACGMKFERSYGEAIKYKGSFKGWTHRPWDGWSLKAKELFRFQEAMEMLDCDKFRNAVEEIEAMRVRVYSNDNH